MNMLKQLNDAIAYMERNLCGELDYGEAARIACVTEDSFKRFFSYMTGMSVNEYIRRRRLTLAAYEVQETDARIIDIAVKYHYESADAFTKAFVKQHGVTPTQARKRAGTLKVYSPVSFHIMIKGAKAMEFRIVEMEETEVYGISRRTQVQAAERFELERIMWSEEEDYVPKMICDGFDGIWYGIWSEGAYMIARKKEDASGENLEKRIIPAGKYAAFTTERGGYAGDVLPRLRDLIFNSWLPDSGYRQSADLEIEIYHLWTKREERREKRYFEIWVPIA